MSERHCSRLLTFRKQPRTGLNLEKGGKAAEARQGAGPGGGVGPAGHLTCPAGSATQSFLPQQLRVEEAGQHLKLSPSSFLPFLAAGQSLSYGKQDKGSDFMSAWTVILKSTIKNNNEKITAVIRLHRSRPCSRLGMGLATLL